MTFAASTEQLGKFVLDFQRVEQEIQGIACLLSEGNEQVTRILIAKLDYGALLTTVDAVFEYLADVKHGMLPPRRKAFHDLITELHVLGRRRNDLVHSTYTPWQDAEGNFGLIRENIKLDQGKGVRQNQYEELLPNALSGEVERIKSALERVDQFRLEIINWLG